MLRAILNKSRKQHSTKLQLYGLLPPIPQFIQIKRTRHVGHCWKSKEALIIDVLLRIPLNGCASLGKPTRNHLQQLCTDTGCRLEDLPEAMDDRDEWQDGVRKVCASGTTWWWWWWCIYRYIFIYRAFQHYLKIRIFIVRMLDILKYLILIHVLFGSCLSPSYLFFSLSHSSLAGRKI